MTTDRISSFVLERRRMLLVVACLLTIVAVIPASQVRFDNSLEIWFLEDDPGIAVYNHFSDQFAADEIVVLGVFHDDVFDAEILSLIDRITTAIAGIDYVFRVQSITNSTLTQRLDGGFLDPAFRDTVLASPVMNDTFVVADGSAAAVVAHYARAGAAHEFKSRFVAELQVIASRETRGTSASFAMTGAPVMGVAGQDKNRQDLGTLVPLMFLVILLITYAVFRSIWLSLLPLTVVIIAVIWSFAIMGIFGWPMTMLSAMLMPLILAVGVADTIHVVARFRDQLAAGSERLEAVRASLKLLLKPCFFTTITTMTGLLALLVSQIEPVRQFGVIAAAGVLAAFLISITLVPAMLIMIPAFSRGTPLRKHGRLNTFLAWTNRQSRNHPGAIISSALLLLLVTLWLATRVPVGLDPLTWFPAKDPFRVATERVDEAFGGSLTIEFLVSAPGNNLDAPATLRRLERFESWLLENTDIARTFSLTDMVKEAARISRDDGASGYTLPRSQFVTDILLESLQQSGELRSWVDPGYANARISARLPASAAQAIVQQTPTIRNYLRDEFGDDELQVQMTGNAVLVGQMQDYVIKSQIASFSVAIIAISLLMFLLLKSLSLGLLALIPNLIPIVAGLAAMTIFGVALNPGTVMITAVALGIVVDDTVHFMVAVKRQLQLTSDVSTAIEHAVGEVGRPIIVTSVLLVLGFSVLLFGSFLPSRQFGGISALIIVIALFADLILLPAALRLLAKTATRQMSHR